MASMYFRTAASTAALSPSPGQPLTSDGDHPLFFVDDGNGRVVYTSNMEPTAALAAPVYLNRPGVAVVTWTTTFRAVSVDWQGWADSNELAELHEAAL